MKSVPHRPIAQAEAALLRRTLERAPLEEVSAPTLAEVATLNVIGVCECGCRTIYFQAIDAGDRRIADGTARTPSGAVAGVMIWASGQRLAALEVVDYESTGELPAADTVCPDEQVHEGNDRGHPV
jgi:hypothetical protein